MAAMGLAHRNRHAPGRSSGLHDLCRISQLPCAHWTSDGDRPRCRSDGKCLWPDHRKFRAAEPLVKANSVLFKLDSTPYDAQVRTIEAQLKFQELRLAQMKQLQGAGSGRAFD